MRNTIAILMSAILFACSTPKPEGFILKVKFQPENKYMISTIRGTETTITYSGEKIAMQKIKSMHIKNPSFSAVKTKTDSELETGKTSADGSFTASLTLKKMMSLDGKNEIPEGTVILGKVEGSSIPKFGNVVSGTLSFDQKNLLLQTINSSFEQFSFTEQRLKTGEQFSVDRPLSLPMDGTEIETIVTTTYKLMSIKNNLAQFEITQNYQMTPKRLDNSFSGKGNGKGQLIYDMENFLVTDYSVKTDLEMNKKMDYFEFDLKTTSEFSQTTEIEKK